MMREGIRQLVTRGEAFVLRPSLDPTFLRWLWSFRRSCSASRFEAGVRALLAGFEQPQLHFVAGRLVPLHPRMFANDIVFAGRKPR